MTTIPVQKIFGILLVIAGLAILGFSLFQSFQIFTGEAAAPALFSGNTTTIEDVIDKESVDPLQEQFDSILDEQLGKLLPTDSIPQMMDLIAWSVFASLLFFGGAQVSSIGVKLLRS
tara:strand:+ start:929 stop:1279 length:351 start_codon:yes stop_codon:yes gene_type:complete